MTTGRYDISKINGFYLKAMGSVCYNQNGITYPPDWRDTSWVIGAEAQEIRDGYIKEDGSCDIEAMFSDAGARFIEWQPAHGWSNQPEVLVCPFFEDAEGNLVHGVNENKEIVSPETYVWREVFFSMGLIIRPKDW